MTPGGFVSFPERKATSAPRRGQKREFVSVIQGNIDLVLQSTTLDRSL